MASTNSWFASISSPKTRLLSSSSHELPRWRTSSPMAASIVPPPIVQSTRLPPPEPVAESIGSERPSAFDERQGELEADLQFLLDAQAEGLIRGLEGGSLDDRSSTGSTTPTLQSISARRQGKRIRRRPGLRSARKGIYNSIIALSALKDDEIQDIDIQIQESQSRLDKIDNWEQKRQGLEEASRHVDSSEEIVRVQRLKEEADSLQAEINQVELQLAEMKSRHRNLVRRATAVENSVQAKMASYSSSLRMLEDDIQKFLNSKPVDHNVRPSSQDGKQSIWQLPPKRRNLDMAKEYWSEQHELTVGQRKQQEHEAQALVDGANLWKDAVTEIADFEKRLRSEMSSLRPSSPSSQSAWEDPPSNTDSRDRLRELINNIDSLIASLEEKHKTADERNWRLLIAALGAELDALRRGREILTGVLGAANESENEALVDMNEDDQNGKDSGDEIRALDKSFETSRPLVSNASDVSDGHDEPDPELLFSRQDTDTE